MSLEVDMRGNTIVADAFTGTASAVSNVGNIVIGAPAIVSEGTNITLAADDTLREALQAILDAVDPSG